LRKAGNEKNYSKPLCCDNIKRDPAEYPALRLDINYTLPRWLHWHGYINTSYMSKGRH